MGDCRSSIQDTLHSSGDAGIVILPAPFRFYPRAPAGANHVIAPEHRRRGSNL